MKRKKALKALLFALWITMIAIACLPGTNVHAGSFDSSGSGLSRTKYRTEDGDIVNSPDKKIKKGADGRTIYEDPILNDGWTYDISRGDKETQSRTSEPWYLTRQAKHSVEGAWIPQIYKYTDSRPVPYDESKWSTDPIHILTTSDDKLADKIHLGSGVAKQLVIRESASGHKEEASYAGTEKLHDDWDGTGWSPKKENSSTGGKPLDTIDSVEGATEWKIWTYDNLYRKDEDKDEFPDSIIPKDLGLPYKKHYTEENHLLKYDKTKPVVEKLEIDQKRLSDIGITSKWIAENTRDNQNSETRKVMSDDDIIKKLDEKMTTTITLHVSDQNNKAFHGKNDVSGIQTILVKIQGNNGTEEYLTWENGKVNNNPTSLTRTDGTKNREKSADAEGTYTWTGNLYNDRNLEGASSLMISVEITDQGGNKQTSVDENKVTNPNPDPNPPTGTSTDKRKIRNYDAVSAIFRNDTLNEKFNNEYVTEREKTANKNAQTIWGAYKNKGDYKAFFDNTYNKFQYGEFATVKSIAYGSAVRGYDTDFNYNGAGMSDLVVQKHALYNQSPYINRRFGENDNSEAGNTRSTEEGSAKILTYNTRFPIISKTDKNVKRGDLEYALNLDILTGRITYTTKKAYRTPKYEIGTMPKEFSVPHVRISTNHGTGKLTYK